MPSCRRRAVVVLCRGMPSDHCATGVSRGRAKAVVMPRPSSYRRFVPSTRVPLTRATRHSVFPALGQLSCCRRTVISKRPFGNAAGDLCGPLCAGDVVPLCRRHAGVVLVPSCISHATSSWSMPVCAPSCSSRAIVECHIIVPPFCRCAVVPSFCRRGVRLPPSLCGRRTGGVISGRGKGLWLA